MFRTRLISGIVLVIIALFTIITGDMLLAAVLCAISVIAFRELTGACGVNKGDRSFCSLESAGMTITVLYYIGIYFGESLLQEQGDIYVIQIAFVVTALLSMLFVYVFTFPKYKAVQIQSTLFAFLYAPLMLSFIYLLREQIAYGQYLVWYVFFASWGSDTCAYVVGVLFGKHKMSPKLSPKKSVEGAVGGIVGAALLFVLYTYFVVYRFAGTEISLVFAAILGALGAMVSMVGDLAASAVKRDHAIKDYGKLIPGHGGIMDRFDSVIITAPLIYLGLVLMQKLGFLIL